MHFHCHRDKSQLSHIFPFSLLFLKCVIMKEFAVAVKRRKKKMSRPQAYFVTFDRFCFKQSSASPHENQGSMWDGHLHWKITRGLAARWRSCVRTAHARLLHLTYQNRKKKKIYTCNKPRDLINEAICLTIVSEPQKKNRHTCRLSLSHAHPQLYYIACIIFPSLKSWIFTK